MNFDLLAFSRFEFQIFDPQMAIQNEPNSLKCAVCSYLDDLLTSSWQPANQA